MIADSSPLRYVLSMTEGVTPERYLGKDFAEFFGGIRFAARLSLWDVAMKVGVTPATIKNWERGYTLPWPGFDDAIARSFDLTEDEINGLRARSELERKMLHRGEEIIATRQALIEALVLNVEKGPPLNEEHLMQLQGLTQIHPGGPSC